ncbi:MAG TPA: hypothetical protein VN457_07470 [Chlamydiales bacterium]|nr:hypothetical protein [Chlamydiales bacterium]
MSVRAVERGNPELPVQTSKENPIQAPTKPSEINLETELELLFKSTNFTDPNKPHYCDPHELYNRDYELYNPAIASDQKKTVAALARKLTLFTKHRAFDKLGTCLDATPEMRNQFYEMIENRLCRVLAKLKTLPEKEAREKETEVVKGILATCHSVIRIETLSAALYKEIVFSLDRQLTVPALSIIASYLPETANADEVTETTFLSLISNHLIP